MGFVRILKMDLEELSFLVMDLGERGACFAPNPHLPLREKSLGSKAEGDP